VTAALAWLWFGSVLGIAVAARPRARRLPDAAVPTDAVRAQRRPIAPAVGVLTALICAVLVSPLVGVVVGGGAVAWPRVRARRAGRLARDVVLQELPDLVDLVWLATASGLTVPLALAAVARRAPPRTGAATAAVLREVAAGARTSDALALLPELLGDDVRPLARALVSADRDGTPLAPALERLAVDLRQQRRRRAEEAARRVPVKLLFPLVACVLPAFALLTVAPLLVGAFRSLRL
jgi:tight adherence protein C